MHPIPYGTQSIDEDDVTAVIEVLGSSYLTQGPAVELFEEALSSYCKSKYAVAVNSATSALHIACLALEVGSGDVVWTSPISFVASANCALYCGAEVDFVDIDPITNNICMDALKQKLSEASQLGKLPKALIAVHMAGLSCDMQAIHLLAQQYGFRIIEDASHAFGARFMDKRVGCCEYSDITVFSFHPVKIFTTAEGGSCQTNCEKLASKMRMLRGHGITKNEKDFIRDEKYDWSYEQQFLGFNYRMSDLQAALGLSQIKKVDKFVEARNHIADYYDECLSQAGFETPIIPNNVRCSYHLYIIKMTRTLDIDEHKQAFSFLRQRRILVNVHYAPIYLQPFYQNLGFVKGLCPNAERYEHQAISIPIYPRLTTSQLDYIVSSLKMVNYA